MEYSNICSGMFHFLKIYIQIFVQANFPTFAHPWDKSLKYMGLTRTIFCKHMSKISEKCLILTTQNKYHTLIISNALALKVSRQFTFFLLFF